MTIPKTYFQKFQTKKYHPAGPLKRYLIGKFIYCINNSLAYIKPNSIIELGCGEGFVCSWLKSQHNNIEFSGVDINKNGLLLLKKHSPQITTYKFDLYDIDRSPIWHKKFDLLLCLETLEHLKYPQKFLPKLKEVKCDNFIISTPREPFFQISNLLIGKNIKRLGNDPEHLHNWNNNQLIKLISKNFIIYKTKISFPWQIMWLKKIQNIYEEDNV